MDLDHCFHFRRRRNTTLKMNHRHYEDDGREVIEFGLNDDTTVEDILSLKQQAFLLCKKFLRKIQIGTKNIILEYFRLEI